MAMRYLTVKDRMPAIGDVVLIEGDGEQRQATVYAVAPRGDFQVDWYAGRNRFAPNLPGHWFCEFDQNGNGKQRWMIVRYVSRKDGGAIEIEDPSSEEKCTFDPTTLIDVPLGMLHCPECGEPIVAGVPHPDYSQIDYSDVMPKTDGEVDKEILPEGEFMDPFAI